MLITVSRSQGFFCYSVPKVYAVIVACAIMMIWTCVGLFLSVPIPYGLLTSIYT